MLETLESTFYFLLLLGGLIFFHELGHFLFARWVGIHVVTFSIGFGPTLFKIKGRKKGPLPPTEYVIGALPLGGYVRMLGADPSETLTAEEEEHSFERKALWKRFLVIAAGPGFNLILPYFIYFFVALAVVQQVPSFVGMVDDDSPASVAGLRSGDLITAIDGEPVSYWWQVKKTVAASPEKRMQLTVQRTGQQAPLDLELTPSLYRQVLMPGLLVDEIGRVGIAPDYLKPVVMVVSESVAYRAGLRNGDQITHVADRAVGTFGELVFQLQRQGNEPFSLKYLRSRFSSKSAAAAGELFEQERGQVTMRAEADGAPLFGVASMDCVLREVVPGSRADQVGLVAGDIMLELDGISCRLASFLVSRLKQSSDLEHEITWSHGAEIRTARRSDWISVPPRTSPAESELRSPIFGVATATGIFQSPAAIANQDRWTYAIIHAVDETHRALWMNVAAVTGLLGGKVPMNELSGPIGIAKLASETAERGWPWFFGLMVWLSISLGLLNLLPIPVLDGGHLLFFAIEAIQRRPVSLRTRQIATYAGLAFIILLMVMVVKFDIERVWG